MKRKDFELRQYDVSVTAGMNQRYHQTLASAWKFWNSTVQITVAVLAVIGVCLAVAAWLSDNGWVDASAVIISSLAAMFAIALNVIPLGDRAQEHLDLFRRWTDLREDIDSLEFILGDAPSEEQIGRLRELSSKVHRICASEPGCDKKLLEACSREEDRSRARVPHPSTVTAVSADAAR